MGAEAPPPTTVVMIPVLLATFLIVVLSFKMYRSPEPESTTICVGAFSTAPEIAACPPSPPVPHVAVVDPA